MTEQVDQTRTTPVGGEVGAGAGESEQQLQQFGQGVRQTFESALQRPVNVGEGERTVSVAAGSILALLGLSRRSIPGLLLAAVGGALIHRGATGYCHLNAALGVDKANDQQG